MSECTYGDITRPEWLDVPFHQEPMMPVLMAGAAEHVRAYAISQERCARALAAEIAAWKNEADGYRAQFKGAVGHYARLRAALGLDGTYEPEEVIELARSLRARKGG